MFIEAFVGAVFSIGIEKLAISVDLRSRKSSTIKEIEDYIGCIKSDENFDSLDRLLSNSAVQKKIANWVAEINPRRSLDDLVCEIFDDHFVRLSERSVLDGFFKHIVNIVLAKRIEISDEDLRRTATTVIREISASENRLLTHFNQMLSNHKDKLLDIPSNDYDGIQKYFMDKCSELSTKHPLSGYYTATPTNFGDFPHLISTPVCDEALSKFPKIVKASVMIDTTKYVGMVKDETPWDYAYRTQSFVRIPLLKYEEFLGEVKDPYPEIIYREGMEIVIGFCEFPEPIPIEICSGKERISGRVRRIPCTEYGRTKISCECVDSGLTFVLSSSTEGGRSSISITKLGKISISQKLNQEKFLFALKKSRRFIVRSDGAKSYSQAIDDDEIDEFITSDEYIITYLENLYEIENAFNIRFNIEYDKIYSGDYILAYSLKQALYSQPYSTKMKYDRTYGGSWERVSIFKGMEDVNNYVITMKIEDGRVEFLGFVFKYDIFYEEYFDAKINNIRSVMKNIERKHKNILLTFKPINGKESFMKRVTITGLDLYKENT